MSTLGLIAATVTLEIKSLSASNNLQRFATFHIFRLPLNDMTTVNVIQAHTRSCLASAPMVVTQLLVVKSWASAQPSRDQRHNTQRLHDINFRVDHPGWLLSLPSDARPPQWRPPV